MNNKVKSSLLTSATLMAAVPAFCAGATAAKAADKPAKQPNIVWYMTEDLSPQYLALYNNGKGAKTPNLTKFAKDATIFNHAYSNAPVSSAARTTLITSCYAPSFGGALHRKLQELPMPEGLGMFPSYLREVGYYTCNAQKTDYNVMLDEDAWDKINGKIGSWRDRPNKNQPFFYVRTNAITHEGKLLFNEDVYKNKKTATNPKKVNLHPYLPDTDLVRYTYATFYDRIMDTDKEFGQILGMLKEDGLMDDTFIFFFGDNGGSLPGSKGYTGDNGLHVPLVVYVPQAWREAVGIEAGTHADGLVSFMDFGPTILQLAGAKIPKEMDGRPFLNKKNPDGFDDVFCYGDRFDDLYAFNRVLYKGKYRYSRNFTPYHSKGLFSYYRYKSLAFQEWRDMYHAGKLNAAQSVFFEPQGAEELYDLEADPNELKNLANDPTFKSTLKKMRGQLKSYMDDKVDVGFLPECILLEDAIANPHTYGSENKKDIVRYHAIADLQLLPYAKAEKSLMKYLASENSVDRWWALTSAASFGKEAKALTPMAKKLLNDPRSYIRSRAMEFLATQGVNPTKAQVMSMVKNCKNTAETLIILCDLSHLKECGALKPINIAESKLVEPDYSAKERILYLAK